MSNVLNIKEELIMGIASDSVPKDINVKSAIATKETNSVRKMVYVRLALHSLCHLPTEENV